VLLVPLEPHRVAREGSRVSVRGLLELFRQLLIPAPPPTASDDTRKPPLLPRLAIGSKAFKVRPRVPRL
jgi:hypothetical protein